MDKIEGTIDPGHGLDPGAIGKGGTHEADVNLEVGKLVGGMLEESGYFEINYTRKTDIRLGPTLNADLSARADIANKAGSDFFISIHCNSAADPAAHGIEVFTTRGNTKSDALATSVIASLEKALPELSFRKDTSDGDPDKEAGFAVLARTKMKAILIEMAFISNPGEEKLLVNREFQKRVARAIYSGVMDYYGIPITETAQDPNAIKINAFGIELPGVLIGDYAYAPVTALTKALGITEPVTWRGDIKTVVIG